MDFHNLVATAIVHGVYWYMSGAIFQVSICSLSPGMGFSIAVDLFSPSRLYLMRNRVFIKNLIDSR